jgi:predicted P-loop ATPase
MQYDRLVTISAAGSRHAAQWPEQRLTLGSLYARFNNPARSTETMESYLRLSKSQQDTLKDVGGFVFGELQGGRRKANSVLSRDGITLDADNIQPGGTEDILRRVDGLGCGYAIYSTRKHQPAAPRLRIILPLDRTASTDEYEPIARKAAELIDPGMNIFDPTTFEASRLMYWPSCCCDGEFVFRSADKPLLSADGMLQKYADWHNWSNWPQVPGAQQSYKALAAKQQDPETKSGVVGAWCKVHNIYDALENVLPGVYIPTERDNRFTYAAGSTTGGAIIYEDGAFLYSHHATDPAGGKLCNSFDLCRLHLFGNQDGNAKPDTPPGKLPSWQAMSQYARNDPKVEDLINAERYEQATADFREMAAASGQKSPDKIDTSWMKQLKVSDSGKYEHMIFNAMTMLENDPRIKGKIRLNTFSGRIEGTCPLPWAGRNKGNDIFEWTDTDDSGLRNCIEQLLKFHSADMINDALLQVATENEYNPVKDYLQSLKWDNTPRIDALYQDYFGEQNTPYTRQVSRKSLVAAVARVMNPGIKYDEMVVICGPQGTYKSTFVSRLGGAWAAALMVSFDDPKAVAEVIQGNWIIEIPELSGMSKADTNTVKQMISQNCDEYRAAYARRSEKHPRQCVLFGTTNDNDYLKDPTGNRRFWPIDYHEKPRLNVWEDLTPEKVNQLWAEAVIYWQTGEPLTLSPEAEKEAEERREGHTERDDYEGQIIEFLDRKVPSNWMKMDPAAREMFLNGAMQDTEIELVHRDRICVLEVLHECLGWRSGWTIRQQDSRRIARILDRVPGWEKAGVIRFGATYGRQKGWRYIKKKVNREMSTEKVG